jgi:hypothetical protein
MSKATGLIIKADNVRLQGRIQLGAAGKTILPKGKNAALTPSQAHIVETSAEYAVIEIICSCGAKTYVKCEYASAQPPAGQKAGQTG